MKKLIGIVNAKFEQKFKDGIVQYDNTEEELKQIDDQKIYEVYMKLVRLVPKTIDNESGISVEKYHSYESGVRVKVILQNPFKNIYSNIQIKIGYIVIFEVTTPLTKFIRLYMMSYDLYKYANDILNVYTEEYYISSERR